MIERSVQMIDIYIDSDIEEDQLIEIQLGHQGEVWINVGGLCRLRIKGKTQVSIDDDRANK